MVILESQTSQYQCFTNIPGMPAAELRRDEEGIQSESTFSITHIIRVVVILYRKPLLISL